MYIDEAHATDVWPIGTSAGPLNKKHKCLDDRQQCALNFSKRFNYKIPIYLDNMTNGFKNTLKSWPFRALIIKGNKLCYSSVPYESEYNVMEIYNFFNSL